jgi:hypothetical protein
MKEEIDDLLKRKEKDNVPRATVQHIGERIRTGLEIRNNLPEKGFLNVKADHVKVTKEDKEGNQHIEDKVRIEHTDTEGIKHVEFTDGLFNIDLRNDANWWFIRTPDVVPGMINQAVRTALDVKKCHEPEKRKLEFPYVLIIAFIIGAIIIGLMFWSMIT